MQSVWFLFWWCPLLSVDCFHKLRLSGTPSENSQEVEILGIGWPGVIGLTWMSLSNGKLCLRYSSVLVDKWGTISFQTTTLNRVVDNFIVGVAAAVCVCVCVCVFVFFRREGFFRVQDVQDILEGTDQQSCVVNISWLRYAKFHHRRIRKCHISPVKTKLQLLYYWRENDMI